MMKRAALAGLALLVAASAAHADSYGPPGASEEPPAAAAPQNEDWNNVSHINGTPVPVGERNRYLYDYKKTNLTVNPFGLFFGYYDVGVAHGVTQNVALAGSITGVGTELNDGYQATVSAPIYFRRTFSGPYLEPGLVTRTWPGSR